MSGDIRIEKILRNLGNIFPFDFLLRHWQACFLIGEFLLDLLFIYTGPYFPIDYDAYLDQIALIVAGERNYDKIKGRTGPVSAPLTSFPPGDLTPLSPPSLCILQVTSSSFW